MSKRKRKLTPLEQTAQLLGCSPTEVLMQVQQLVELIQQPWAVVTLAFHPRTDGQATIAVQGVPDGKPGMRMVQRRLLGVAQDIAITLDRMEEQESAMERATIEEDNERDPGETGS